MARLIGEAAFLLLLVVCVGLFEPARLGRLETGGIVILLVGVDFHYCVAGGGFQVASRLVAVTLRKIAFTAELRATGTVFGV